jgi:hypothetical protein
MRSLLPWFGTAAIIFLIFGTIYGTVQQSQRHDANYPQIQLAEDAATALDAGADPATLITDKKDFGASLAPFVIIYDKSGKLLATSGWLGSSGEVPAVPFGVLKAAEGQMYHFVTWQPQDNVRIAAVTVAAKNYYILSGRSLKEVETNEQKTFELSVLGGAAALAVLGFTWLISSGGARKVLTKR